MCRELIGALLALPHAVKPSEGQTRTVVAGHVPGGAGPRVALYSHFSPSGRVDAMVLRQLSIYHDLGFEIVFTTASQELPPEDLERLKGLAALIIHRANLARDFGAWKDAMPEVARRWTDLEEVLLVNDSILGPIFPLNDILARMRQAGAGLIGLVESQQGPPHLQSFFLLIRGGQAIDALAAFFRGLRLTNSRWLIVRRGEYGLTRFFRRRGFAVLSLFPFAQIQAAAERAGLTAKGRPINPTHHAWACLIEQFGFPYLKRDLLMRNPNHIPDIDRWGALVPGDAPVSREEIEAHLNLWRDGPAS